MSKKIAILGTGYVGLVSGTCFADIGHQVICLDIDENKINTLNQGHVPIFEPGLEELIKKNVEMKRLSFSTDIASAVEASGIIFIAVGTPTKEDGSADLSYVFSAAESIAKHCEEHKVIVVKSTVPIGTGEKVRQILIDAGAKSFDVVSNPEFLREGNSIKDFMEPERIVIGVDTKRGEKELAELYEPLTKKGFPLIIMDNKSSEMTKYAANAFLATKISFINEISNLCDRLGANVDRVREGIGSDSRIGPKFLFPGVGYGGSCFPKDVKALIKSSRENHYQFRLLEAVEEVNQKQKNVIVDKILSHYRHDIKGKLFAIWGLAFKPETDDMREAPSLEIVKGLLKNNAQIRVYDPVAEENAKKLLPDVVKFTVSPEDALKGCDALVIITEWASFKNFDLGKMKQYLRHPVVFDGRNVYQPEQMKDAGYTYISFGRSPII